MTQKEKPPFKFTKFSDEQIASFKRDGFLVVPGKDLFYEEQIADLLKYTAEIEGWKETPGKWMMYYSKSVKDDKTRILHRIENFFF